MEMEVNKQFQSQLEATGMIPACELLLYFSFINNCGQYNVLTEGI